MFKPVKDSRFISNIGFSFSADFDYSDTNPFKAAVTYDGNVTWVVPMITMSSCQINVENFPFDEQVSDLTSYVLDNKSTTANLND